MELLGALDEMLGEHQAYWSFWEAEEPDDVVEIYGGLPNITDTVAELYSEPRVVKEAAARGLKASLSVDLKTGYDLLSKETKNNVRAELRRRRPRLLVTSPPCTKFSQLQNLRPYPERLQEELPEAIDRMTFSMEMQEEQLARGDHGLHEHPDTATSWMLPVVKKLLAHERIRLVKSHLCRFGLQVGRDSRMRHCLRRVVMPLRCDCRSYANADLESINHC